MKIDLEVLASTEIKGRKPWPKIIWIGEEQESLLLLDAKSRKASVLYVPSGKTKKKLPKISHLVDQVVSFTHTKNGRFLLGLLSSGSLFVWLKDKDVLRIITGLQNLTADSLSENCLITASDDCCHVFVAVGSSQFFLWEMQPGESIGMDRSAELHGTWHKVAVPATMELPTAEVAECSQAAVFFSSQVFGDCCQYSLVYNKPGMLSISTLLIRFPKSVDAFRNKHLPKFSSEWSLLEYPFQQMHPTFDPLTSRGAYVSAYAPCGQVLAVAANQMHPSQTAMLFVSPLTDTVLVSSMKGCGTGDPDRVGSQYWIADLAWTSESLFVVCMLRNGSVCLIPRLGEPTVIQTQGCSMDMGPARFLALHPAFLISGDPGTSDQNPMHQQFSLATHPSLPIMLFSDGFLVTVLQLPVDMTCVNLMRDYVLESAKFLKKLYRQENLDMTVADAYKLSKGQKKAAEKQSKKPFEFEFAEITLNSTRASEASMLDDSRFGVDPLGAFGNMDSGKIVFGEPEMISLNLDSTFSGLEGSDALLKYLEESMNVLVSTWKLAVSYCDIWTADVDNISKQTIHNLTKIFSVVLDCPAVEAIIPALTPRQSSTIQNPRVYNMIVAYRNVLQLLRFDTFNQHLIPATLRLVHKTVTVMLASNELDNTDPRLKTLFGCFSLIKHAETSLNRTYTWVPSAEQTGSLSFTTGTQQGFEPAVMVRTKKQAALNGGSQEGGVKLDHNEQLPGKRLCATWKLLYKYLMQHQTSLEKSGDPNRELEHLNKLMYTVQQTLQESGEVELSPRRASPKLTSAVLSQTLPFELLSERDCFPELEEYIEDKYQPSKIPHHVALGDKLSVDGEHTQAVQAWKEQLRELAESGADNPKTARMLHSVLYTYLLKGELGQAVEFIDNLILQASISNAISSEDLQGLDDGQRPPMMTLVTHTLRSQDSTEEELVPCIKNKSIRQTVQTMARYMAAYFSNQTLFIYPPHNAQPLPSVHTGEVPTKKRIIPKYHEDVSNVIRREALSSVWTTERAVEYLLLSGLICETAWFAHKMGDWKTAFLLSVSHFQHRDMAPLLYTRPKKPLQLPENLRPEAILKTKLQVLIQSTNTSSISGAPGKAKQNKRYFIPVNEKTDLLQMTQTLQEILTAGIICQVELSSWLLSGLVDKLKVVVSNLSSLVPQDFYLPSPPLYCPQPAQLETRRDSPDVEFEKQLRTEISSIIQLVLVALNSTRLSLHTARWYIQDLFKVQDRASQFKATTEGPCLELPEILQQYKIFRSAITDYKDNEQVGEVMSSFRDFCSILWLLHARDELSMQIRKRGSQLSNQQKEVKENTSSTLGQDWVQDCFQTLKWAVHLLPFTMYLQDDGSIHRVILSLLLDLPATEDIADILAEHFYTAEILPVEVQEKLERLLASWQSVEILPEDDGKSAKPDDEDDEDGDVRKSVTFFQASPRAKTLSVYFHKQCEVVPRIVKKKSKCFGLYEEFVFNPNQESENTLQSSMPTQEAAAGRTLVGSRPFETKQSYFEFLDRFYAISFSKVVEKESERGRTPSYPLLMPFVNEIREREFQSFLKKYEDTYQMRPRSIVLSSPRVKFFRSQSESHVHDESDPKQSPHGGQRGRGLFRSSSSGDVQPSGPHLTGLPRYESESALQGRKSSPGRGDKQRVPNSPTRGKANMTGMASRFFQSEDVLYRDAAESQDAQWILDVNFGQRYMALQQMLDWLYQWGCKQHFLGLHGKQEQEVGLKPTMRIEVPTQLVVLGLWLLEHKYSPSKKRAAQIQLQQQQRQQQVESEQQVEGTSGPAAKSKALDTVEEVTEHESFTVVTNQLQKSRSQSPYQQRSRSHSPADKSPLRNKTLGSITSEFLETEQVQSAYQKVLNGGDDSSSLEVSSLGSDEYEGELRHTLSLIRSGDGRKSRSPRRRSSPSPRRTKGSPESRNNSTLNYTLPFASSPERGTANKPPQTSTPVRNRGQQGSKRLDNIDQNDISRISQENPLRSAPVGQGQGVNTYINSRYGNTAPPGGNFGNQGQILGDNQGMNLGGMDLAGQLQQIVRGELRRMMEVQHQSMMAMMGALDGNAVPVAWPPANQIPGQPSNQIPQQGQNQGEGSNQMRGVLGELKNLQLNSHEEPDKRGKKSHPGGKENLSHSLRMSELNDPHRQREEVELYRVTQQDPNNIHFAPNFLRIPAERDTGAQPVRFPHIPTEAWASKPDMSPKDEVPSHMPLLHVERTVPGHIFPKSSRQQPTPYFNPPTGSQGHPPPPHQPLPPYVPGPRPGLVLDRIQTDSPDSGIGIPLLKIPSVGEQPRQPVFGELLPPDVVIGNDGQVNEQEQLRLRYDNEFKQLQVQNREEQTKKRFGDNLLHIDFQARQAAEQAGEQEMDQRLTLEILKAQKDLRAASPSGKRTPRTPRTPRSKKSTPRTPRKKEVDKSDREASAKEGEESEKERQVSFKQDTQSAEGEETGEDMEMEDLEEESVEEEELHDGYAIKEGEFESYLNLQRELGAATDTNAKIQLLTALKLKQMRVKRKKVDFGTMTQEQIDAFTEADEDIERAGIRTSEKATSITKDTGVDPIQEAVIEFNRRRQPQVLPPDIYMGLRFGEGGQDQPSSSRGRSYINVVDLDASAIMRDLQQDVKEMEAVPGPEVLPTESHLRSRMALEEVMRSSLEPVIERPTRADQLTVRMFDTKTAEGQDRMSIAIMPRESLPDSKADVILRLREMNQQLEAIDRMSNNMEKDFKHTRLTLHTLDQMRQAMEPPTQEEEDQEDLSPIPERDTLTPKPSLRSPKPSVRTTARTARSRKSAASSMEEKQQLSTELAKMSGLSGISDIIGDMVAHGEINLEDAGLTQAEADRLVKRGAIRQDQVKDVKMSLDEIKRLAEKVQDTDTQASREHLHEWMMTKRAQRTEEYLKNLQGLREREARPFKQGVHDQTLTGKELHELEEERKGSRKNKKKEFMSKRLDEAQRLLGNIMSDKPQLPKEPPPRQATPKKKVAPVKQTTKQAFDKTKVTVPSYVKKPQGILKTRDTSPPTKHAMLPPSALDNLFNTDSFDDDYMMQQEESTPVPFRREPGMAKPFKEPGSRRIQVAPKPEVIQVRPQVKQMGIVPRLKLSLDDVEEEPRFQQTAETTGTGDLSAYTRAMEAMDVYESHEHVKENVPHGEDREDQPRKPYKFKPYTEVVKVQRPHVTRKQPIQFSEAELAQMELLSESESARDTKRDTTRESARVMTQREKEMIYGSKRIPGMKKPTETTPRHIKTYTERLQDMKGKKTFSTPVAPRSHLGSSVVSGSARPSSRPVKPKHKPVTYVEQLQKLNAGTKKPRMTKTTVIQKTMMKSHKPLHKPKTYSQQLQELQEPPTIGPPSRRTQMPTGTRVVGRQRPYKDPYQILEHEEYDQWERDSVVSGWSMGSDVRQILYNDRAGSVMPGRSVEYAPSEQMSDYYDAVMGDSYTASVDIDEIARIADAASVSSGSMASVIDWDQVDDLIADIS